MKINHWLDQLRTSFSRTRRNRKTPQQVRNNNVPAEMLESRLLLTPLNLSLLSSAQRIQSNSWSFGNEDTAATNDDFIADVNGSSTGSGFSGGRLTLEAGDDLTVNSGVNLHGNQELELNVDFYGSRGFVFPAPVDPDPGVGGTLTLNGTLSGSGITLFGHTDNDVFDISSEAINGSSSFTIDGWEGDDTANLNLTGATGVTLTRNNSNSTLTYTRSGGGSRTVTIENVETINVTGATPTLVDNDDPDWDSGRPSSITVNQNTATGADLNNTELLLALEGFATDIDDASLDFTANPATFPIGTTSVTFTATDDAGNTADATFDVIVEAQTLTVSIVEDSIAENAGFNAANATVTRTGSTGALVVTLTSDDESEGRTFPTPTVTIADGQTSASFTIDAINDDLVDGTQTVTITASATGFTSGSDTIDVTDDGDVPRLTLSITANSFSEGAGAAATTATVTRNTGTTGDLTVNLASNDTSELIVPATVMIPDGDDSVTFDIAAVDDAIIDGAQNVTITATATEYTQSEDSVIVTDDDAIYVSSRFDGDDDDLTFGQVTLREAIRLANADPDVSEIRFDDSVHFVTITLEGTQLPEINESVTIVGPGANSLTVSANDSSRIFSIQSGTVEISGLTLTNGNTDDIFGGGAVANSGTLVIRDAVITNSTAAEGGGGIANGGDLTLERVEVSDNSAAIGGGIDNATTATIIDSMFTRNMATGANVLGGGGIANSLTSSVSFGTMTLINSTVYDNQSASKGGGIWNLGDLTTINSTIAGNTAATSMGGGIYQEGTNLDLTNVTIAGQFEGGGLGAADGSTVTVNNTLIAGNMDNGAAGEIIGGADLTGRAMNSLIGDAATAASLTNDSDGDPAAGTNNIVGVDWTTVLENSGGLPTLADNSGHTMTAALLPNSPAIDAGDNALAVDADSNPLPHDQRGFIRILDGNDDGTATVDIGAIEAGQAAPASLVVNTDTDIVDGDYSAGELSLREAINIANDRAGADQITFDAALSGSTILLTGGQLELTDDATITGPGNADDLIVDAQQQSRIFRIDTGVTATLTSLTVTNGDADGNVERDFSGSIGGGILNAAGTLTLDDVNVMNSTARWGGGINNYGPNGTATLNLLNSTVSDNTSGSNAAGLYNWGENGKAVANVVGTTFDGNTAGNGGGAIYNWPSTATLNLQNSTLVRNTNNNSSLGTLNSISGRSLVAGSTITGNTGGSAVRSGSGTVSLHNTIIAGNRFSDGTSVGVVGALAETSANNLIDNASESGGLTNDTDGDPSTGSNNIVGVDWKTVLANDGTDPILADNGGLTQTVALLPNSPAIDAGVVIPDALITPTAVASSTSADDLFPASQLIDGSGISQTLTVENIDSTTHTSSGTFTAWVTDDANGPTGDYFDASSPGAAPVLTFTLPELSLVTDIALWSYSQGGFRNGAKDISVAVSTDGGATFNDVGFVSLGLPSGNAEILKMPGGPQQANAIRLTITDNHYEAGQAGGDRVGLAEVRFLTQGLSGGQNDQRGPGFNRVLDGDNDGTDTIDIGSFEAPSVSTLIVTSLASTDSGFTANFNLPLDAELLNLTDSSSGQLGPADITLVGASTGAVRGSLLVNSAMTHIEFVSATGALPPDDYTVTLRSADNGFADSSGDLLDGDEDNTPGGNYVEVFIVGSRPADEVTVSLPSFTRGAGQDVNLPTNSDAGIPLTISTGVNVTGVDLDVAFNPDLLDITGFTSDISGVSAAFNLVSAGLARITLSSATDFSDVAGELELGRFTATVPETANYAGKHILDIRDLNVEDSVPTTRPSRAEDGLHVTAYVGDASGNGFYSSGDTTLLQRVIVGSGTGATAFQNADPLQFLDLNNSGTITSGDATLLQRIIVGIDVSQAPPPPTGVTPPAPTGADPRLEIPQDLTGAPGDVVTVPVNMTVTETDGITVSGMDLAIQFDETRFTAGNVRVGSLLGSGFSVVSNTDTAGVLRVTLSQATGPSLAFNETGPVLEFDLTILGDAVDGASSINLLQNFESTVTAVSDNDVNELTLVPAPSNAGDDTNDGIITVATPDTTAPTLAITPDSGTTSDSPITFTFEFNEDVTGFDAGDVALTNGTAGDFTAVDSNTYTLDVTPDADGDVTASVAAGAAEDAAANESAAASATVSSDTTAPTVAITPDSGDTGDNPIVFTFEFSEDVTGFEAGDITLTNGTPGTFTAVDGNTYTLEVAPSLPGDVIVSVAADAAMDAATNGSEAGSATVTSTIPRPTSSLSIPLDLTGAPDDVVTVPVNLTVTQTDGISVSGMDIAIQFDETRFTAGNAQVGSLLGDGFSLTANTDTAGILRVTLSKATGPELDLDASGPAITFDLTILSDAADGESPINILQSFGSTVTSVSDNDVNEITLVSPPTDGTDVGDGKISVNSDTIAPTVAITPNSGGTSDSPITFTFEFSEDVTGFEAGDVTLTNGTAGTFTEVDANTYTLEVTPDAEGDVTASVAANAAADAASNGSTAGTATVNFDTTDPTVTVTPNSGTTSDSPIVFTIEFSEDVTGFNGPDVTNSTAGAFTAVDGNTYTVEVTPDADGDVTVTVPVNFAVDAAGNPNTAGSGTITFDSGAPTLAITPDSGTTSDSPITFTFEFSEDVTGFDASDVTLTNGTAGNFAAVDANTYTLEVTPDADGDVTVAVAAGAATDATANDSEAASATVSSDTTGPTVTITPNSGSTAHNPIVFTFEFSEDVTGFEAGDITLTNGTAGTFTAVDGNTYTLDVTPDAEGDVTASVAADAASDSAGNGSEAGSATVSSDTTAPTVTITPGSGSTSEDPIDFSFQFSETVANFDVDDISVINGTKRTFRSVDGDTFTLSVAPQSAGDVTLTVAAGSATDAAGNTVVETSATVLSTVDPTTNAPTLNEAPEFTDEVQPTVGWDEVDGVTGYEIWFARVTPNESRLFLADSIVSDANWAPPSDLDPAHYRYWVRTVGSNGARGPWSAPQEFDVRPTLTGPLSPTFEVRPTFTWEAIPDATAYQIFIRTQDPSVGENGDIVVSDIPAGTTSYTPTVDLPGGTIRWWIRATDSRGNRGWSDVGITGNRTSVTSADSSQIAWQAVTGSGRYVLHVEDASGTVAVRQDQLTDTSFAVSSLAAGNYRAWVKAIDGETNLFATGFWSRGFNFTVAQVDSDGQEQESTFDSFNLDPLSEDAVAEPVIANSVVEIASARIENGRVAKTQAATSQTVERSARTRVSSEEADDAFGLVDLLMADHMELADTLMKTQA